MLQYLARSNPFAQALAVLLPSRAELFLLRYRCMKRKCMPQRIEGLEGIAVPLHPRTKAALYRLHKNHYAAYPETFITSAFLYALDRKKEFLAHDDLAKYLDRYLRNPEEKERLIHSLRQIIDQEFASRSFTSTPHQTHFPVQNNALTFSPQTS